MTKHKQTDETTKRNKLVEPEEVPDSQEQFFKNAFEHAATGMALTGLDGHFLRVNRAWCDLLGYTEKELLALTFQDITHTDDLETNMAYIDQLLAGETASFELEKRYLHKLGHPIWVQLNVSLQRDDQGQPLNFIAQVQDISERKRAEEELTRERDYSRMLIEGANAMVVGLDADGQITIFNKVAEEITGYTLADLQGKNWFEVLVPQDRYPEVWEEFARLTAAGGIVDTFENPILTAEGEERIISWRNSVLQGDGTVIGTISFGLDVTERRQLGRQIEELLERRGRQVRTSTEVTQEIAAAPTLEELFRRVVDLVQARFDYYHAHLYTLEEGDLVMQAGSGDVGRKLKETGHKIAFDAEQSLVARAARSGQPVLAPDVSQEPGWLPNPLLPETKAEIVVPIKLREQVLGVLDVQNDTADSLSEEDQILLEGLCGQIAGVIDSTRVLEEANIFRQFAEASGQGLAMATLDGKVTYANPTLCRILGVAKPEDMLGRAIAVFYPEELQPKIENEVLPTVMQAGQWSGELALRSAQGKITPTLENIFVIRDQQGNPLYLADLMTDITERKQAEAEMEEHLRELHTLQRLMSREGWQEFQTRQEQAAPGYLFDQIGVQPVELDVLRLAGNGQADLAISDQAAGKLPTGQAVTKPLAVSGERIGALGVYDDPDHPLSPEDQAFLDSVAAQVAEALERARLLEQSQASLAEADMLYRAGQRVNEASDLQEVVAAVAEVEAVPVINRAVLFNFEHDSGGEIEDMTVVANWHSGQGTPPTPIGSRFPRVVTSVAFLFSPKPLFLGDIQHDERVDPATAQLLQHRNIRAMAVLPLWVGARQLGTLLLEAEEVYPFTEREMQPYLALARQIAVAVDNQRLLVETQAALTEVEATQRRYTIQAWETYRARSGVSYYEQVRETAPSLVDELPVVAGQERPPTAGGGPALQTGDQPSGDEGQPYAAQSGLEIPLRVRGQIIGVLGLEDTDERDWSPEEKALVEAIAQQFAEAAEQLRLIDETQQRAARERRVGEIGDKIRAAQSLEEALQIAVKEVGLSLQAPQTRVQLDVK